MTMASNHICGLYYLVPEGRPEYRQSKRKYLPQLDLSVHTTIIASTARTTLTQKFVNPSSSDRIDELRYTFPLYDGVSVVAFKCTISNDRVIRGVVKERQQARQHYQEAVDSGKVAALLEQLPDAKDVFTTTVGNVPAAAALDVEITYLGELKNDAEVDGVRFTLPTSIAPRYGKYPGELLQKPANVTGGKLSIVVDAEMPANCPIQSVQSPTHPISVKIGSVSTAAANVEPSFQMASATLSLGSAELDKDFVVQVVASNTGNPIAVLETHPSIPSQRALMATLVPRFNLPSSRPEVVFICDRSGSMDEGQKIPNLKSALELFLRSLPVGVKFNICSFGSSHSFLFEEGSRTYDKTSLDEALRYIQDIRANMGGTEMYSPLEDTFKRRYQDMELEVFMITDGEIWDQARTIGMVGQHVDESHGAIRIFTLGVGRSVSHGLIEGLARSGNGFSQTVSENERMNTKVVRMLKAALMPHVNDYTLEVQYGEEQEGKLEDDDWETVERVMDALVLDVEKTDKSSTEGSSIKEKVISLFDPDAKQDDEAEEETAKNPANKFDHLPVVEPPKLLQAPFKVPPLFPFNRSTVYLLLSSDTCQKTPRSVVLRGTSKHGPLRLEVPITILSEKAHTIHQLAARKAVQELEDGRGWLRNARDSTGKLLKHKFEGRFGDMVEREGVRLGVQFQVANKWCSFVAVEDNAVEPEIKPARGQHDERYSNPHRAFHFNSDPMSAESADDVLADFDFDTLVSEEECEDQGFGLLDSVPFDSNPAIGQARCLDGGALALPPPPPAPAPASAGFQAIQTEAMGFSRGSTSATRMAAPIAIKKKGVMRHRSLASTVQLEDQGMPDKAEDEESLEKSAEDLAALEALPPSERLEALLSLQSFDGYWSRSDKLLKLLGVEEQKLLDGLAGQQELKGQDGDALFTLAVLAWLGKVCGSREEEWEMVGEKAVEWLREKLGGEGVDVVGLVKRAEDLFSS